MVAHNIADVSLLFVVMARRRAFFQEDPSIVVFRDVTVRCTTRQNQGGAMPPDGSSDQSGGYQELRGEWSHAPC